MHAWITDRWMSVDKTTGRRTVRKAAYGKGVRWQVSFYGEKQSGVLAIRSRNFEKKSDAVVFRTRTKHELRSCVYVAPEDLTRKFESLARAWLESKRRPTEASSTAIAMRSTSGYCRSGRRAASARYLVSMSSHG